MGSAQTKKGKFKTESMAVWSVQISGVVPPFGLKLRMVEEVARKLIMVTRCCNLILRKSRAGQQKNPQPSLHSSWITSIGFRFMPRRAGYSPAASVET